MGNHPRRLRDFFAGNSNRERPSSPRETDELMDEITVAHELDLEGIARELNQSHRRLWHKVEDELEQGSKPRLRDRLKRLTDRNDD